MAGVFSRLAHGWNAFKNQGIKAILGIESTSPLPAGNLTYNRPDRLFRRYSAEKTIISSIYTRLSIDIAGVDIFHVNVDTSTGRYESDRTSGLQNCLTVEANIDQGARQFRQDVAEVMFDKGVCAIVPVDTTMDPNVSGAYDIQTLRVGEVTGWYPQHVRVSLYNEAKGYREEITLAKKFVAIVQNPLYSVMNEQNSTLQRLIRKLNMLDAVDEASSSGKLNLIIQLPYVVRSEARKQQAKQRRQEIEDQLKNNEHGIAYTDGTEKITQLNTPITNNLLDQVQYLTSMVYSELGLTDAIMNGTADEATMLNYIDRTIKPCMDAFTEAMKRTFLTKAARAQGQSIMYFRDPFALVPLSQLAELADVLSRNEVATPNDLRNIIGWKPSKDPKANQLSNSNMPDPPAAGTGAPALPTKKQPLAIGPGGSAQNGT